MDKLNLMASFIAVAEEGSYTAAAKRLGKTTPLISTHISQLEERLEVRLITRSTRSMQLTDTGISYYEQAKKVLDDIASLESSVRKENQNLVGRLRISAPVTFGEQVLMPFIADMVKGNPQLITELMLNDRYVDIVAEGFDIAIRIGQLEDSALIARRVGATRMLLCASPAFLDRYGSLDTPHDLQTLPCVFDSNYRQGFRWGFKRDGVSIEIAPQIIARVNSAVAAARMATTGLAITYAPDFAVKPAIENGSLVEILTEYCQTDYPISVVYPHRKHLSVKVSSFVEEFESFLKGLLY